MDQVQKNEIIQKLINLREQAEDKGDFEESHEEADKILCDLLISLGHKDIVDEYLKVPKWYS